MQTTTATTTATATNYVFITLCDLTNAIIVRVNSTHNVFCNNANDIIAAFKQFNITKYDTIMCSDDCDFAAEFGYANDSAVHNIIDDALIACNI